MKIQLIKAPTRNTGMPEHFWYMPLNLIWLANYIIEYGYEVEILDGQFLSLKEIIDKLNADVVGVSFDILSINEFGTIIKEAKFRGSFTVTGGHLATAITNQLLETNNNLDAVIRYDGEEAFLKIIRLLENNDNNYYSIPNLLFRNNNQLIETEIKEVDLNCLPIPKRKIAGLNVETYIDQYQISKKNLNLNFNYNRPTNSYSHKGCLFRQNGNGCSFCSRVDTRFRLKKAINVYKEYRYLADELKIDHISDFSDSWIYTPFLKDLEKEYEKNGNIDASIRAYGDVRLITKDNVRIMKNLGVDTILLGIESGNERILKHNGKNITINQILNVVDLLAKGNIKIADAYILGLIGETRESVNDTIEIAKEIRKRSETEISYWNIFTPIPGSKIWKNLIYENEILDIKNVFKINTEYLEKMHININCNLGKNAFNYLKAIREKMLNDSKIPSAEFINR